MSLFLPNVQKIVKAITTAKIAPSAKEIAAELVDAWISEHVEYDSQFKTLAVEIPWFYWLEPGKTILIGVMDRLAQDKSVFGSEWKSCKEPQTNKDGSDSAWWNAEVWLEGISTGTQLSIYGLGLHRGTFTAKGMKPWVPKVDNPRIMVRAAVKSSPPRFWPTTREDGVFQFPNEYLDKVEGALASKAHQIRAARKLDILPWALPGNHCTNRFRKLCPYHEKYCISGAHPRTKPKTVFDESDPGSAALVAAGLKITDTNDPELVVFSASSYDTAQQCVERYRILVGGYEEKEQDQNLDIGTGLHAGLAELYRQMMVPISTQKRELYS